MTNQFENDPRTVFTNPEGDVIPHAEDVFERRDLKGNREFLELDHPGFSVDEVTDRSVEVAKGLLNASDDLFGADTSAPTTETMSPLEASDEQRAPYTVTPRLIKGRMYLCAVGDGDEVIYKRELGDSGSPELFDLVGSEADKILASRSAK